MRIRSFPLAILVLMAFAGQAFGQYPYEREKVERYRVEVSFDPHTAVPADAGPAENGGIAMESFSRDGEGVYYDAPPALTSLVSAHRSCTPEEGPGYRIQIFAGPGLDKAKEIKLEFMRNFEDLEIYTNWDPPTFRVQVGDYLNPRDASEDLYLLKQAYPSAFLVIVKKIKYPRYRDPDAEDEEAEEFEDEEEMFDRDDMR